MPQLWHYLLRIFFKIFGLCFLGSLGVGLLVKHKKFTEFIATGASFKQASILALGFLCRPLPFVIALSTLAGAFFLTYRGSASSEVTAMRASGMSLRQILFPVYCIGIGLSLVNFFIASELIPYMQLMVNDTLLEEMQVNPLLLLKRNVFPLFNQSYVDITLRKSGTQADDALIIFKNEKHDRLILLTAEKLSYEKEGNLEGERFSIITQIPTIENYDHLYIEHQQKFCTPSSIFQVPLKGRTSIKDVQIYPLQTLMKFEETPQKKIEILNRISKGLLPFSLVLLGTSFGLFIGRCPPLHFPLFILLAMASFISFFLHKTKITAPFILFLPHLFIYATMFYKQRRLSRGIA